MDIQDLREQTKWCVFDLDGTLLTTAKRLEHETITAVRALRDQGIRYTLASGRHDSMMRYYAKLLDVQEPLISSNGAALIDGQGRVLEAHYLPEAAVRALLPRFLSHGFRCFVYAIDGIYSSPEYMMDDHFMGYQKLAARSGISPVRLRPLTELPWAQSLKIFLLLDTMEEREIVEAEIRDLGEAQGASLVRSTWSGRTSLDLMHVDADKGKMLRDLEERLAIDPSRLVVFGDQENDLGMFDCAGFSFAMKDAISEIHARASGVAPSNDAGGVPRMLRQWVLRG